jgi:predicted HTH domain antitoxin
MKTITFNIPDTVELDMNEAAMLFASKLYEKGKLSLGQAADLAGVSKRVFIELLGKYGVSVFNYPPSDIEKDLKNAERYNI